MAITLLLIISSELSSHAQVAINNSSLLPDPSAMLDVSSTTRGMLAPRVTSVQRTAIVSPADGLWVYDTDNKSFWYYKNGTGWQQIAISPVTLTFPYSASFNSPSTLFSLSNTGTGMAVSGSSSGNTGVYGSTSTISGAGLLGDNNAGGEAVTGRTHSGGSATGAVVGRNDGAGYGVYGFVATDSSGGGIGVLGRVGISNSKGVAGHFENLNINNAATTLEAVTNGVGSAATFTNSNSGNTTNTINVTSNGPGVIADHSLGNAGNFFMNNGYGVGAGVRGEVNSIFGNNGTAGVYGVASGTGGYGGYFEHSNSSGFGYTLYATNAGLGGCSYFTNSNSTNAQPVLQSLTNGTGSAGSFVNNNNTNTTNTLDVTSNGPGVIADHSQGNAGNFLINNTYGVGAGVRGEVNSIFGNNGTAGVYGVASGTGGYGGYFEHSNSSGYGYALYAITSGQGTCAYLVTSSSTNSQPTLQTLTSGTGSAAIITNSNSSNTSNALIVNSNGSGVPGDPSQGNAANFFKNNTGSVGAGVRGEVNSIYGNSGTAGVYGVSSGTGGYGGYFEHSETTGYGIALEVVSYDHGTAMVVDHEGDGYLAIFSKGGSNKARIDNTGKGFFDGGTQNSGADVAEAFDVEGSKKEYEPGDVLQISVNADRTVTKSNEAYSSLVIGVYATKPGVLLTETSIDSTIDEKIPLGVIGVIPTKVCNENGAIHRGDILVTSGKPGYAMKADLKKLQPGQSIGKALEDFDSVTGKIKVLVNVR
jgi:hypothetical protein